ncbi:ORF6C domain-containing protein [Weissella tructae]|uniref:ORF6C domain-containing protein n=1 Tax=Weissella tructae TaxID=887702 RepID=UPI003D8E77C8
MNDIITIQRNEENEQVVSARELHKQLGSKKRFSDWWKQQVPNYREEVDFTMSPESDIAIGNGATRKLDDYMLTTDTAKEIALMSGTEKGKQIRNYFIAAEKELRQVAMQPMTTQQQIALIAQGNTELNTKVDTVVSEVNELKEQFGLPAPQAKRLEKVRKKYVVMLLGGFDSNAYRKMSGKVFAEIGRDFKDRFDLPRYDALPMSRFDEAIEYLEHWQLPTNLGLEVRELNAQTALEV